MHSTLASSVVLMTLNSGIATLHRYRAGDLAPRTALRWALPIAIGAIVGVLLVDSLSDAVLRWIFVVFVVFTLVRTIRPPRRSAI